MLRVHSIETFGAHEGPGIRLVVFLQGCNLKCLYCHNPDTHEVLGGKQMSCKKIVEMALDQKDYFGKKGGVTVSGGEPLLQADRLVKLFKDLKEQNIHTVLDTSGSIINDDVKELLQHTDLVLVDVKHIDPQWHKKIAGADLQTVLKFIDHLKEIKKPFWLRYVLVPGLTDQPEFLKQLGEYFQGFHELERLEVLPYHRLGVFKYEGLQKPYALADVEVPTKEQIARVKEILLPYFKKVCVR